MTWCVSWWRHQTFSALLALCAGNSPVTGEFPAQRPVTRSFDVFFDLRLNKLLSKQSRDWWFETLSRPLWRHCNVFHLQTQRLLSSGYAGRGTFQNIHGLLNLRVLKFNIWIKSTSLMCVCGVCVCVLWGHSRLMYNVRFILWPLSFSSRIRNLNTRKERRWPCCE